MPSNKDAKAGESKLAGPLIMVAVALVAGSIYATYYRMPTPKIDMNDHGARLNYALRLVLNM